MFLKSPLGKKEKKKEKIKRKKNGDKHEWKIIPEERNLDRKSKQSWKVAGTLNTTK